MMLTTLNSKSRRRWLAMWSGLLLIGASGCKKKSSSEADEAGDLSGESTPLVVSGAQPVEGNPAITIQTTESGGSIVTLNDLAPVPGASGAISAEILSSSSIRITWTAAADDNTQAGSLSYQVYYSTTDNIGTATQAELNGTPWGARRDGLTTDTVTGLTLTPSSIHYFNVVVRDGAGNRAVYSRKEVVGTIANTAAASAATSVVSVANSVTSIAAGTTATLTLRAKDADGNYVTTGGSAVTFTLISGASRFSGTFPVTATDNGDGSYTATVTGTTAGTAATIGATVDSVATTSTTTLQVTPGPASAATSVVSILGAPTQLASGGTATIQLRAKDGEGNDLTAGGVAVTFIIKTAGTSTFAETMPLTATDLGNGLYSATITGAVAGTATTLGATVAGTDVSSATTLTVVPGAIAPSTSQLSIVGGASSVNSGASVTVRLQAKDAAGNNLTAGGAAVAFTKTGGTSTFSQAFALAATDNNDGTYTATLTGASVGTAATIGALIGALPVTSTVSLGVSSGTISESTSTVTIVGGASTVASGSTITVRLQAKDSSGNNLSSGGASVTFTQSGGASTFSNSFPVSATDNGDGTYTAVLTGAVSGSATTLGAKIGATTVTSTTSVAVTPGTIATGTSIVSIVGGASTVASGTSVTVRLQAKDAAGNTITSGGATVAFTKSGGTSTFSQSLPLAATDNGDGTYTAQLTGAIAGTATTLGATIGGAAAASTTGMTVTAGAIAAATSVVSIDGGASTVASGANVTIRLTGRDAAGNPLTAGGATVTFTQSAGASSFVQGFPLAASDNGDGTYSATLTGNMAGSAATLGATVNGAAATSTTSLTVTPGAIATGTSVVAIVGGASTLASGASATVRLQAKDAAGNNLTTGGSTVTFTQSGGTSTFTQTFPVTATDNGNGTYTATITGNGAGTASTLGATVGATPVTSTTTLAVVPGAISTATSQVTAGAATVPTGVNVTVTLTAYDAANNPITAGGATVTFTQSGGTSTFTQSFPVSATDNGDGTYTATLTGSAAGTATTIGAKIGASTVTDTVNLTVSSSVGATISGYPTGTNNTTVLNVTVAGTSVTQYMHKVGETATTDCTDQTGYAGPTAVATPITNSIAGLGDVSITLCVVGADGVPNWQPYSSPTTTTWTKKATPPSFTSLARAGEAADGYINAADRLLASELAGTLVASAYTTATYKLVADSATCSAETGYGAMPLNTSGDFGADGDYKVCVKLTDNAGNTPAYGATTTITLKVSLPDFTSLALAGDAADGAINAADRLLANALAGTLVAANHHTAAYKLVPSATACSGVGTWGAMPLGTSTDFGSDGAYKVCVKLTDNAQNPADYGSTADFDLKTALPSFNSLALAGNAADGYINAADRLLANPLAGSLDALNYTTATYKLVTSATACSGATGYGALPLGTSSDFGAQGAYKVCVKLEDNAQNPAAYGWTSDFTLKTSLPGFTSLARANQAADGYINAADRLLANALADSLSGTNYDTAEYRLVTSATTCSAATGWGTMPLGTSTDFGAQVPYKVCAKLTDAAGNPAAYGATTDFTLKTALPAFNSLALLNEAANGYINAAERSATNPLAGSLSGSDYDTADYKLVTSATTCSAASGWGAIPAGNSGDFGAQGDYKICARLTDNANNTPAYGASGTFTLDTVAPTPTLGTAAPNPTNTTPFAVTVSFDESVTGFAEADLTLGNGTSSSFSGSGASYSFNLAPSGQGAVTVNVTSGVAIDAAGNGNSAATQLSRTYDSVAPSITNVTSTNSDGTYADGVVITITVAFNEAVNVTGTPTMTLNTTPTARTASYSSGSGTSTLSFTYTTQVGDSATDLDYSSTTALTGTIKDAALNSANLTMASPGTAGSLGANKAIVIDTTAPAVSYADSTLANGAYTTGTVIPVRLTFTEAVTVTGTPTVALNTAPARSASYSSGSGTTRLVFNYTVQAGDTVGDLDYASTGSLALSGGTIVDVATGLTNAILTLPVIGSGNSLGDRVDLQVDTTSGTVSNVTSGLADGTYPIGTVVDVIVAFTEPAVVTGSPRIQLNVTPTTRYATYTSGSGTGNLTFNYTVQDNDLSSDLDYASTTALQLNGGTIKDAAGNNLTLTLATPGASGSLGANSAIVLNDTFSTTLTMSGVTCCASGTLAAGAVELTISNPAAAVGDGSNNLKIYRLAGATPPADACASGTLVTTLNTWATPEVYVDSTGGPGKTYSYRICYYEGASLQGQATAAGIVTSKLHWLFATNSAVASGNLGGASGANSTCQTAGNTVDPTLSWVAVLSDAAMEAAGRAPVGAAIYNRAATPTVVATTYTDLWDGTLATAPSFSQTGTSLGAAVIWTGSTSAGLRAATSCTNWGSNSAGVTGGNGVANSLTATWAASATSACNTSTNRLYCMSKVVEPPTAFSAATPGSGTAGDIAVTVDFPADTTNWSSAELRRLLGNTAPTCSSGTVVKSYPGPTFTDETYTDATGKPGGIYSYTLCVKSGTNIAASASTATGIRAYRSAVAHMVFVSNATYAGNMGIANADAGCDTAGDTVIAGKTWKAILADGTNTFASRVTIGGEVRNLAGDAVAANSADLFDGAIASPISYTELFAASTAAVWTGMNSDGSTAVDHCTSWGNNTGGKKAMTGLANSTGAAWIQNGASQKCNTPRRLFCITTTAD